MTSDPGRTLVTGATGFLARHLLPLLPEPVCLVRSEGSWRSLPHAGQMQASIVVGTVDSPDAWVSDGALRGVSTVVHLAALVQHTEEHAEVVHRTNVAGTLALLRACARLGARFVFVSTSGTVGCFRSARQVADEQAPFCEETVKRWPYYLSKIVAEREATRLAKELGVRMTIVRMPVLLGPGDHRGRSVSHVVRLLRGHLPFIVDGGIAYADVRDVAQGIAALVRHPDPRPIYHLPGTHESLAAFFGRCAAVAGVPAPRLTLPGPLARGLAAACKRAVRLWGGKSPLPDPIVMQMAAHHWGFGSLYASELGYRSRPADETLRDTIAWIRSGAE